MTSRAIVCFDDWLKEYYLRASSAFLKERFRPRKKYCQCGFKVQLFGVLSFINTCHFLFKGGKGIAYTLVTPQDNHFTADLVRNLVNIYLLFVFFGSNYGASFVKTSQAEVANVLVRITDKFE